MGAQGSTEYTPPPIWVRPETRLLHQSSARWRGGAPKMMERGLPKGGEASGAQVAARQLTREAMLAVPAEKRRMGRERALLREVNETARVEQLLHFLGDMPSRLEDLALVSD